MNRNYGRKGGTLTPPAKQEPRLSFLLRDQSLRHDYEPCWWTDDEAGLYVEVGLIWAEWFANWGAV